MKVECRWFVFVIVSVFLLLSGVSRASVAEWNFEPDALSIDSSGNNHYLNITGVVSPTPADKSLYAAGNNCVLFNGAGIMQTSSPLDLSSQNAIEIEWDLKTTFSGTAIVFEQSTNFNFNPGAVAVILSGGNLQAGRCGSNYWMDSVPNVADGQWHHFKLVIDKNASTVGDHVRLYKDGRLGSDLYTSGGDQYGSYPFVNDTFYVGARYGMVAPLTGKLDQLKVSSAPTATPRFNPDGNSVAEWSFEPNTLNTDSSGNNYFLDNNGVISPTPADKATNAPGTNSALFSGNAMMRTALTVDLSSRTYIEIEWDLKTTVTSTAVLFEQSDNYNVNPGAICVYVENGSLYAGRSGENMWWMDSVPNVADGQWHHYKLIIDKNASTVTNHVKLYKDGQLGSDAYTIGGTQYSNYSFVNDIFYIGARFGMLYPFTGNIDQLKIVSSPTASSMGTVVPVAKKITITSATPNAVIYYTTDGSEPTTSSALYTAPVKVCDVGVHATTLKAIAVAPGREVSTIKGLTYTIWKPLYQGIDHATAICTGSGTTSDPRPMKINVLRIDTQAPGVSLYTTPRCSSYSVNSRETIRQTTSNFLIGSQMKVAINCNPYQNNNSYANLTGLAISNGTVVSPASNPACSLLISQDNQARIEMTNSSTDLNGVYTAVSGWNCQHLINGYAYLIDTELDPRTGIGLSQDNRYLYLLTIDGRQSGVSEGATMGEVGYWLLNFGAWNGFNVDGGGSTCMVKSNDSGGATQLNVPIDGGVSGRERAVGNNFGVNAAMLN